MQHSFKSILLPLDGSTQSRHAADLAWSVAQSCGLSVTAQHVVDAPGLWSFLAYDLQGFTGSGPYVAAYENMCQELLSLGQTLLHVYETYATSRGVAGKTIISEGNPVREILREAIGHDLVIMGHKKTGVHSPAGDRRIIPRLSKAERVAHYCQRPLLVVQGTCATWSRITLVLSSQRSYPQSIAGCLELAALLKIPLEVCCWVQAPGEEDLVRNALLSSFDGHDLLPSVPVTVTLAECPASWWMPNIEFDEKSLLVVPVVDENSTRETSFGSPPDEIIRYWPLAAVMFWPEEYRLSSAAGLESQAEVPAGSASGRVDTDR